jgi:hypothetical protein
MPASDRTAALDASAFSSFVRPTCMRTDRCHTRLAPSRSCTLAALAIVLATLAGCATTSREILAVQLSVPPRAKDERIRVSDLRKADATVSRVVKERGETVYLGDSSFKPSPPQLIEYFLAGTRQGDGGPIAVELTRFDVGIASFEPVGSRAPTPFVLIQGTPASATAVGNVLGQSLVALVGGGSATQSVFVTIDVRVAAKEVTISDYGSLYARRSASEALETVLVRALESLANRIAEADK